MCHHLGILRFNLLGIFAPGKVSEIVNLSYVSGIKGIATPVAKPNAKNRFPKYGHLLASCFVARRLQITCGYTPSSRLALRPKSRPSFWKFLLAFGPIRGTLTSHAMSIFPDMIFRENLLFELPLAVSKAEATSQYRLFSSE
jgi:hypothetical protein